MNNWSIANEATTTSLNSANSAMNEQEKYSQSLEGRINRLDTAWNKLTLSVGDAVLTDSLVVLTESLSDLATSSSKFVEVFGVLPVVAGTLGIALALLSTRFKEVMVSAGIAGWGMLRGQITATTATTQAQTVAVGTLSKAWKSALLTTGIGAAFVVLGFAIEKVTNKIADNIREQEEFNKIQDQNAIALTTQRKTTEDLIASYDKLSQSRSKGEWDIEKEQEYVKIQNELGTLFPSLIQSTDALGNNRLVGMEQIKEEIKLTEQLLEIKREEIRLNANDTLGKTLNDLGDVESTLKAQQSTKSLAAESRKTGKTITEVQLESRKEILATQKEVSNFRAKVVADVMSVATAYSDLEINSGITNSISDFIAQADFSKMNSKDLEVVSQKIGEFQSKLQEASNNGDQKLFDNISEDFGTYLADTLDLSKEKLDSFKLSYNNLSNIILSDEATEDMVDDFSNLNDEIEESNKLFDDTISNIESLNGILNDLNDEQELSSKSISTMVSKYPELLVLLDDEVALREEVNRLVSIETKKAEELALAKIQTNAQAYDVMYKNNQTYFSQVSKLYGIDFKNVKDLATAKNTVESKVLSELGSKWADYYDGQNKMLTAHGELFFATMSYAEAVASGSDKNSFTNALGTARAEISRVKNEMDSIGRTSLNLGNLNLANSGIDDNTDSTKKNNKEKSESIYITDKYAQAMEKLNLEIEKQQAIQSKFPEYSKQYRDSLQKEIKLQQDKMRLLNEQSKALDKQIKSGKILQTGKVTTTSSSQALSGWSGAITGRVGDSRAGGTRSHRGIDIAQPNGTRLDANVGGKVIASGSATSQGYDSSYGNIVVVQDKDGVKHLYAHLEKAIAKLGSTIIAGTQIGNVGSTGSSTGSHLHYEQSKNGKIIDPTSAVNNARNGVSSSSDIADKVQAVDEAKSKFINLQDEILKTQEIIDQLQFEVINSELASYEKTHSNLQHYIDDEIQKREKLDSVSQRYHDSIKNQIRLNGEQIKNYENERKYLNSLINSTSISAKTKADLTDKVKELSLAIVDLNINSKNLTFERIQATMRRFEEQIDDTNHELNISNTIIKHLKEDSLEYSNEIKKQISLLQTQKQQLLEQRKSLENSLKIHSLTSEQIKEIKEQIEDLSVAYLDVESSIKDVLKNTNQYISDSLSKIKDDYIAGIEKESEKVIKSIEDSIESTEKYYDSLIQKQQERLDALDEEIEKEDRLKALREIDDEINKVKSDKRFSYITESGEEILTYNKERVSELEKQRNEMLQQYQRDDIKKSIQDEINRLEKAKQDRIAILRKEIEDTKAHYEELIEAERVKWDGLIEQALSGTLAFDEVMNEFYATSLKNLESYVSGVHNQIESIKNAYASLASLSSSSLAGLGLSADQKVSVEAGIANANKLKTDSNYLASEKERATAVIENRKAAGLDTARQESYLKSLSKYHDGGIVGSGSGGKLTDLANKLFNAKPNEQVVKSLIGELQVPPNNIPNLFTNINTMISKFPQRQAVAQTVGDTILLQGVTIKADNPKQFFNDLDMYIRMNKS